MWEKVRLIVFSSKLASISFFFLLSIVGMGTAAAVNWISVDPIFAKSFYLGVVVAGTMIILGIILFQPFFTFRFKYKFLDEYHEETAEFITKLNRKSESWLRSTDGIIGIRLFRVEKHTLPNERSYSFNLVFDKHSKNNNLDKLKPKTVVIPIALDEWITNNISNKNNIHYDTATLNKMRLNKYAEQMLLYYFNDYYRKRFPNETEQWYQTEITKAIGDWSIRYFEHKIFKSIHYSTVFEDLTPLKIEIEKLNTENKTKIGFIKEDKTKISIGKENLYAESYTNGDKGKLHRRYYNLHFETHSEAEGSNNFILQVIVDKRIIPSEESVSQLINNLL